MNKIDHDDQKDQDDQKTRNLINEESEKIINNKKDQFDQKEQN